MFNGETNKIEYKNYDSFNKNNKDSLIKEIISFSNSDLGGNIFLNVEDKTYKFEKLPKELERLDRTHLDSIISEYFSSIPEYFISTELKDDFKYLKIKISPNYNSYIYCKKNKKNDKGRNKYIEGAIYIRVGTDTNNKTKNKYEIKIIEEGDKSILINENKKKGRRKYVPVAKQKLEINNKEYYLFRNLFDGKYAMLDRKSKYTIVKDINYENKSIKSLFKLFFGDIILENDNIDKDILINWINNINKNLLKEKQIKEILNTKIFIDDVTFKYYCSEILKKELFVKYKNRINPILPKEYEDFLSEKLNISNPRDKTMQQRKSEFITGYRKELASTNNAIVSGVWGKDLNSNDGLEENRKKGGYLLTDKNNLIEKWLINDLRKIKNFINNNYIEVKSKNYNDFKSTSYFKYIDKLENDPQNGELFKKIIEILNLKNEIK